MSRLLIVGPQGSGKGTQGVEIAGLLNIPAISTGDMFRANIGGETELGLKIKAVIEAGNLVDDALTGEVVRDRLSQEDAAAGFLLDGYPRNLVQVADLDEFLTARGEALDLVVELVVPREESITRLVARAAEQGRSDDTEEVISNRLKIYEEQTTPILDVYRERGIVAEVDGVGSIADVLARITEVLRERDLLAA
ncbi:adenylate kinase [Mycetocola sp. BIGb0189]|uniref:adenylate kinase n=1 Tax=Mycetocola sp. BIGb0189 TaxID=2940604 RepID=UPI002169F6D4|nr:adenylate kinase [Mycetocola sp. BIGb0189]MCS4277616.1 adenylate kinase [Mycetocola sp. BIGb0189]